MNKYKYYVTGLLVQAGDVMGECPLAPEGTGKLYIHLIVATAL